MKTFLGIDVGTTSLKAAVFDENGKRLGFRAVDYTLSTDPATGFIEFDAEGYISACEKVIAELTDECGKPYALSVDTQGETMILADSNGKPLCPAVVWLDNRAATEAEDIRVTWAPSRSEFDVVVKLFGNTLSYDTTLTDGYKISYYETNDSLDEITTFTAGNTYYYTLVIKVPNYIASYHIRVEKKAA